MEERGNEGALTPRAAALALADARRGGAPERHVRAAVDAQIRRTGLGTHDADDVRSEVALALLLRSPDERVHADRLCARAAAIARNKSIDVLRRQRRTRPADPLELGDRAPSEPSGRLLGGLDAVQAEAHRRLVRPHLRAAIGDLDERERVVLAAHVAGSAHAAAGLSRSTFYRVLADTREQLQSRLAAAIAAGLLVPARLLEGPRHARRPGCGGRCGRRNDRRGRRREPARRAAGATRGAATLRIGAGPAGRDDAHCADAGRHDAARAGLHRRHARVREPAGLAAGRQARRGAVCCRRKRAYRGAGRADRRCRGRVPLRPLLVLLLMRRLLIVLACLAMPAPALASEFHVSWGDGHPMVQNGWGMYDGAPGMCGFEDTGTVYLAAGTLPGYAACAYGFAAPGQSTIVRYGTTFSHAHASGSSALCVAGWTTPIWPFGMRRCASASWLLDIVDGTGVGATSLWLALENQGATGISIPAARANNVLFHSGDIALQDPTAPGAWIGPPGVVTANDVAVQWAGNDPESSLRRVAYRLDAGPEVAVVDDGCESVFRCGATRTGSATVPLSGVSDGTHSLAMTVYSAGGASTDTATLIVDRLAPSAPTLAPVRSGAWHSGQTLQVELHRTDPQVTSTALRLIGPSGALAWTSAGWGDGVLTIPFPAGGSGGSYRIEADTCSWSGCTSAAATVLWDPHGPPAATLVGDDRWLHAGHVRDGASLPWPPLAGSVGASGVAGGRLGLGHSADEARTAAFTTAAVTTGVPGSTETTIPPVLLDGARVCLALLPVSGAGLAAPAAGVRCARIDAITPALSITTEPAIDRTLAHISAVDEGGSGLAGVEVTLDGQPVDAGAEIAVRGSGRHELIAVASDGAGNQTTRREVIVIDHEAPELAGAARVSFGERTITAVVHDDAAGVGDVTLIVGGVSLEARVEPLDTNRLRVQAVVHVPAGIALDGASLAIVAHDLAHPVNSLHSAVQHLFSRPAAAIAGASLARCRPPGTGPGCVVVRARLLHEDGSAVTGERVTITAVPLGGAPAEVGVVMTGADGRVGLVTRPARTSSFQLAFAGSESTRPAEDADAGEAVVQAHIVGLRVRAVGDRLLVRARHTGTGETARARLLVRLRSGRWIDACLLDGRAPLRLARDGAISGSCRIPAAARGSRWRYRVALASVGTTWPWASAPSRTVAVVLPRG